MRMCKRAALCADRGIRVESVSTTARTGVGISSLSWDDLSKYSKAVSRDTQHTYSNAVRSVTFSDGRVLGVGDYLNISISGANYQVDIIDFHHDRVTDPAAYGGTYAGITWQMRACYNTAYAINPTDTNVGGWTGCEMRTVRMVSFWEGLSSDLRSAIVWVDKLTSAGNLSSAINTSSDRLFLLSEYEIYGSNTRSFPGEGGQYAYWAAGNSRKKSLDGSFRTWWERSPSQTLSSLWSCVNQDMTAGHTYAKSEYGVSFAFCT